MKAKTQAKTGAKVVKRALSDVRKVVEGLGYQGKNVGLGRDTYVFGGTTTTTANVKIVMLSKPSFDQLVARAEDAQDVAAIDRGQRGASTYLPGDMAMRIIEGESPWRVWREHRGLTLDQLAACVAEEGVKVTKGQLSHVENGRSQASLALASAVAKALDIPLDNLAP